VPLSLFSASHCMWNEMQGKLEDGWDCDLCESSFTRLVLMRPGRRRERAHARREERRRRLRGAAHAGSHRGPNPPGAATRPQRFPPQIGFAWRVCVGARGD
jgi:hypothetical protein